MLYSRKLIEHSKPAAIEKIKIIIKMSFRLLRRKKMNWKSRLQDYVDLAVMPRGAPKKRLICPLS